MSANCPICKSDRYRLRFDLSELRRPQDISGWIVDCRDCDMVYKILNHPSQLQAAYIGEKSNEVGDHYAESDRSRFFFRETLKKISLVQPGRLLDIGANRGTLLEEATKLGFLAEGIELNESNVRLATQRGLNVRQESAENLSAIEAYDAITMMDLIEHVMDPLKLLQATYRALKKNGELVVYTPNHRAGVVMLAQILYRMGIRYPIEEIFGSNHVCFFDDLSLARALRAAGFQIRHTVMKSYDPARPGQYVSPLNLAAITLAERIGQPFNRVFRMTFYARKNT